jgi:hypothetical protein
MKPANQGFIDLHTPLGFFVIGLAFLLLSIIIILGAIYGKSLSVKEREVRRKLKEEIQNRDVSSTLK